MTLSSSELSDCYHYFRIIILDELGKLPGRIAECTSAGRDISEVYDAVEKATHTTLNSMRQRLETEVMREYVSEQEALDSSSGPGSYKL